MFINTSGVDRIFLQTERKIFVFKNICFRVGQLSGLVVRTVASQQEGPEFHTLLGKDLSVWSLHVLPVFIWVPSRSSGFLPQSKDMQVSW